MKKVILWAFLSLVCLTAHPQTTTPKGYTLYVVNINGVPLNVNVSYVYSEDSKLKVAGKTFPSPDTPAYTNYEWFFIPVGDDEPGWYYIRNGNGQYLYINNTQAINLSATIGNDGYKWYLGKHTYGSSRRLNKVIRLYALFNGKNYAVEVNKSGSFEIKDKAGSNAFYLEYSRDKSLAFNDDMELMSTYLETSQITSATPPPYSYDPEFYPSAKDTREFFPLDFRRRDSSTTQIKLLHSHSSSGGAPGSGHYFLRMKQGSVLEKAMDNPTIEGETRFRLTVRTRATVLPSQVAMLTIIDSSNQEVLFSAPLETTRVNSSDMNYHDPEAWNTNAFYFTLAEMSLNSKIEITCTAGEGELLDIDDLRIAVVDNIPIEKPDTLYWDPLATNSADWNYTENWRDKDGIRGFLPDKSTDVVLLSGKTSYPVLNEENNQCKAIRFEDGAQLGNQFYLDYDRAGVELKLNTMQWYALAAPLHGLYSGDYMFEYANPLTEMRLFKTENPQTGMYYADWTTSFATTTHPLAAAMPYSARVGRVFYSAVDEVAGADMDSRVFIDEVTMQFPKASSSFPFYDEITKKPTGKVEFLPEGARLWSHRFVYESEENGKMTIPSGETLLTITPGITGEEVVVAGNPFMAHLGFEEFYLYNYQSVYPEFKLLVGGNEYVTYSGVDSDTDGVIDSFVATHDNLSAAAIPPMTSFALRTRAGYTGDGLVITKSMNTVPAPQVYSSKKSITEQIKIEIVNGGQASSAYVLPGKEYDNSYNPSEDSRKMKIKENDTKPLVYTIVNNQYLEVNRMNELEEILPIGISVPSEASCRLIITHSIAGNLFLADTYKDIEIPFDGNNRIDYPFDSEGSEQAGRFFLLRKGSPLDSVPNNPITVNKSGGTLTVTSQACPIRRIELYNMAGQMLYREGLIDSSRATIDISRLKNIPVIIKIQTEFTTKVVKIIL